MVLNCSQSVCVIISNMLKKIQLKTLRSHFLNHIHFAFVGFYKISWSQGKSFFKPSTILNSMFLWYFHNINFFQSESKSGWKKSTLLCTDFQELVKHIFFSSFTYTNSILLANSIVFFIINITFTFTIIFLKFLLTFI